MGEDASPLLCCSTVLHRVHEEEVLVGELLLWNPESSLRLKRIRYSTRRHTFQRRGHGRHSRREGLVEDVYEPSPILCVLAALDALLSSEGADRFAPRADVRPNLELPITLLCRRETNGGALLSKVRKELGSCISRPCF